MTHNYGQVTKLASYREPFRGNTMYSEWNDNLYWIYSYQTPIALYDPTDDTLYVNTHSYSVTTARHMSALYLLRSTITYEVEVSPDNYLPRSAELALIEARKVHSPA